MLTLEQAYREQSGYRGNEHIRSRLSETSIVAFVGAAAVGKNFLMSRSGLEISGTIRTREPRADDNNERDSYTDTDTLLKDIESKDVVQYGVSLADKAIYASKLENYALNEPNASDIWFDAVAGLNNKGFQKVRSVSIFTPKLQWHNQLMTRFEGMAYGYIDGRLDEARHSVRWSMSQHLAHAANHLLILNNARNLHDNIDRIISFSRGGEVEQLTDEMALDAASDMTHAIDTARQLIYRNIG